MELIEVNIINFLYYLEYNNDFLSVQFHQIANSKYIQLLETLAFHKGFNVLLFKI